MANPTFFIKRNDDTPTLDVALQDDRGRPVNVTGATVVFHMRNTSDDSVKVDGGTVSAITATKGEVRYEWTTTNTNTAGTFEGEFEVTFSGGEIQTFPNNGYIDIIILEDVS